MVIIVTGAWQQQDAEDGSLLTSQAMADGLSTLSPALAPVGTYGVAIAVAVFAFTTLVGWSYYGERCIDFLVGRKGVLPFRVVFV
ncbi:sodium:alanine symporter family protein, partial [Bacillus amyloliquefaciens]|nr:sodium:alanine symporter family protein [Bacillus amyloliquefaciens]